MANSENVDADGSIIKPVSSLRSHFENMTTTGPKSTTLSTPQPPRTHSRASSGDLLKRQAPPRPSLDIPRTNTMGIEFPAVPAPRLSRGGKQPPAVPPSRQPKSMLPLSRPASPPTVDVTSPKSPPRFIELPNVTTIPHHGPVTPGGRTSGAPHAPPSYPFRIPSRSPSPQKRPLSPAFHTLDMPHSAYSRKNSNPDISDRRIEAVKAPPPVNRTAKPKIPGGGRSVENVESYFQNLEPAPRNHSRRISPLSTPNGSDRTPGRENPPPIPNHTKLQPPSTNTASLARLDPQATQHVLGSRPRDLEPRRSLDRRPSTSDGLYSSHQRKISTAIEEVRPALPPRREMTQAKIQNQDVVVRKSFDATARPSALSMGFSSGTPNSRSASTRMPSTVMAPSTRELKPPPQSARPPTGIRTPPRAIPEPRGRTSMDYVENSFNTDMTTALLSEYPDLSRANRRPPHYSDGPRMIATGNEARLFDVCGEYVCTTGIVTRVWSLVTGKLLLSLPHAEGVRVVSLCFKPARKIEDEGAKIWLGTNWGEILEIDIASKRTVGVNSSAHSRHEVVGIYRHAAELWTVDDEGKLYVWAPDEHGSPNLNHHIYNGRVGRRPTASVVVGDELWLGFGKDIRIFKPGRTPEDPSFIAMEQPMTQSEMGDVTSAATIATKPEHVYFGHSDGKVSIYSSKSRSCIEMVNVSLYRINSLVAAGSYLWAGFYTGMIFIYDVSTTPWTVKKDWRAHTHPVWNLVADRSSIWKLDRLQVLSLGTENLIGVWDGLLKDDWLENKMHAHDNEFCTFREVSTLVMTWNVGAVKSSTLRHDERDTNFFREIFSAKTLPDMLVLGLQELVDLENKRATAKSFFKSKKSDEYGQEQLSSVYRAWVNHFSDCLEQCTPPNNGYVLLHSASLVGLFTCIFVKTSERNKIRDVQAAEIKTGLGGLHGNKGALIVRFTLDDSSLCFINCHLAAGQTQVVNRNNDVASILDATPLPGHQLPISQSEVFVSGGDGSMVLDHEICILNGDLNYRIEGMPRDTVTHALKTKDLAKLLERDQLVMQRRKSPGFRLRAFQEAPITFEPTYKYDIGTDNYDSSEKKRVPAWCDRVLYRGGDKIKQVDYKRHEVRISDHRPVSGRFVLRIKTIKADRRLEVWRQCEQRFEQEKHQVSTLAKLDYLRGVFGLTPEEARKLLDG